MPPAPDLVCPYPRYPARALGPAIVLGHFAGGFGRFAVVYLLAPAVGGVLAAIGYKLLVLDPEHRLASVWPRGGPGARL